MEGAFRVSLLMRRVRQPVLIYSLEMMTTIWIIPDHFGGNDWSGKLRCVSIQTGHACCRSWFVKVSMRQQLGKETSPLAVGNRKRPSDKNP